VKCCGRGNPLGRVRSRGRVSSFPWFSFGFGNSLKVRMVHDAKFILVYRRLAIEN
jgi:hypothetical protein